MILQGDNRIVMKTLDPESFHCCITSPPYWGLRDYGIPPSEWPTMSYSPMAGLSVIDIPEWTGCLGLEPTPEMYVGHMVLVFREVWRVLRNDSTLWLNLGDSYAGSGKGRNADGAGNPGGFHKQSKGQHSGNIDAKSFKTSILKPKDLVGIPWRVAFALQADGWYLRMDNIWNKPNAMPESVKDRTSKSHEYVFQLSKSKNYYCDMESIKEPITESSAVRINQDIENQIGSTRANGGTKANGNMKAVFGPPRGSKGTINNPENSGRRNKQNDVGKRAYSDFNERYVPAILRNKRSVWTVATAQFGDAHFAIFPEKLIEPCVLAGCPIGGRILDPFGGSGTTRKVALENGRECTLIEINPKYIEMQERRTAVIQPKLF